MPETQSRLAANKLSCDRPLKRVPSTTSATKLQEAGEHMQLAFGGSVRIVNFKGRSPQQSFRPLLKGMALATLEILLDYEYTCQFKDKPTMGLNRAGWKYMTYLDTLQCSIWLSKPTQHNSCPEILKNLKDVTNLPGMKEDALGHVGVASKQICGPLP
eukprot:209292-Pelagomonas_calceolata.AAC.3